MKRDRWIYKNAAAIGCCSSMAGLPILLILLRSRVQRAEDLIGIGISCSILLFFLVPLIVSIMTTVFNSLKKYINSPSTKNSASLAYTIAAIIGAAAIYALFAWMASGDTEGPEWLEKIEPKW